MKLARAVGADTALAAETDIVAGAVVAVGFPREAAEKLPQEAVERLVQEAGKKLTKEREINLG